MIGDPFFYLIGILVGILIADLIGGASDDRHFFQTVPDDFEHQFRKFCAVGLSVR